MKKLVSLPVIFTFLAAPIFAAEKPIRSYTKKEAQSSEEVRKFQRVVVDESMANREGKSYVFNATLFGSNFGAQTTSLELGKHLDLNTVVSLELSSLSSSSINSSGYGDVDKEWEKDGTGSVISLGLKKFVSNSFYYKPQIYHRNQTIIDRISYDYLSSTDSATNIEVEGGKIQDTGISFQIGNQWQWENFTLGCSWIGFTKSIMAKVDGEVDKNNFGRASALNFYMGYTF